MSDLAGLHGTFPTSVRWNAEEGFLGVSTYSPETGGRELREIRLVVTRRSPWIWRRGNAAMG